MSATRAAVALAVVTAGCIPAPLQKTPYTVIGQESRRAVVPDVPQAEWTLSRTRLAGMRKDLPSRPYAERIRIAVEDPRTGKTYEARGAVAVSPSRAARMILVGPGGTTALDLWVTRDRFRIAIPALKLEKRGGDDLSDTRGLPVSFLRWWFLAPLDGKLVLARSNESEASFLFRDGPATVTLRTNGERFLAVRRQQGTAHLEGIEWRGHGLVPQAGDRGRYRDGDLGMHVDVLVEEVLPDEPDPAAFLDPDEEGKDL